MENVDEENEVSQINIDLKAKKVEIDDKTKFVNMYKKIDQPTLTKNGMHPKQVLSEQSIKSVHDFSML